MNPSEQAFARFVLGLTTRGVVAEVDPAVGVAGIARLDVVVHVDAEDRAYVAQAVFLNDITELAAGADAVGDTVYLQLTCTLPFELAGPERLAEVGTLLFMVNRLMPHPQFGLSEEEGLVYLRAVIPAETRALPVALVVETVDMMQLFLATFAPPIERLATGQAGLDEVVRGLADGGFSAPGLFDLADPLDG